MKIGIVCYPTVGGSGILATELGQQLVLKGHEVHFVSYDRPFRLYLKDKRLKLHKVEINKYDLFKYPDYTLPLTVKILQVSKYYSLDIVHLHYAIPHATSAYLARQLMQENRPAFITTLHGTDVSLMGKDPTLHEIIKFSIEQSDGITTVSKNLREETYQRFSIKKTIEVIYNFFLPPSPIVENPFLKKNIATSGEKILIHSSNFRKVKRVHDIVEIFFHIKKRIKSKLVFLGSGPEEKRIKKIIENLSLENDVHFFGNQQNISPFISHADLFLLSSEKESFSLSALEAMAHGIPIVATRSGGIIELIEHENSGFLSEVGDIHSMVKFSSAILENHSLYEKFSRRGIEIANDKFNAKKIVSQYEELYKKKIGETTRK